MLDLMYGLLDDFRSLDMLISGIYPSTSISSAHSIPADVNLASIIGYNTDHPIPHTPHRPSR